MKIIRDIKEIDIEQSKKLYDEAFNDPIEFRENLFNGYLNKARYFGVVDENNNLIMKTFFVPKRISYNGYKTTGYLIFAVAVKKEFQGKGIMKQYLGKFIHEMKLYTNFIFIQAYNYQIYKSFDFLEVTTKKDWFLRKDQFLKVDNIKQKIDFDLINKINNLYLEQNDIANFAYKTEKENKKYLKLYYDCGAKIIMSNKSYVVYDETENKVLEYAYLDLRDFIKLMSSLPFDTTITSILDLDKRFFTQKKDEYTFTKLLRNDDFDGTQNIYFMDNW